MFPKKFLAFLCVFELLLFSSSSAQAHQKQSGADLRQTSPRSVDEANQSNDLAQRRVDQQNEVHHCIPPPPPCTPEEPAPTEPAPTEPAPTEPTPTEPTPTEPADPDAAMQELHDALEPHRENFATVFQIPVEDQVLTNGAYADLLGGLVLEPNVDAGTFGVLVDSVVSLDAALETSATRDVFASIYGVPEAEQTFENNDYRVAIFAVAGDPNYNETEFVSFWQSINALDTGLSTQRAAVETAYGIEQADQMLGNEAYFTLLSTLSQIPEFDEQAFPQVLADAVELDTALEEFDVREEFAVDTNQPVAQQNIQEDAYRTFLFNFVGDPNYNLQTLLSSYGVQLPDEE